MLRLAVNCPLRYGPRYVTRCVEQAKKSARRNGRLGFSGGNHAIATARSERVVIQRIVGVETHVAVVVHRCRTDRLGHVEIKQVVLVVGEAQAQRHR